MKHWLFIGILGVAFALNAHAGLSNPIEQMDASANDKTFNTSDVNMQMVPLKMWSGGNADQSDKMVPLKMWSGGSNAQSDKFVPMKEANVAGQDGSPTLEKARTSMPGMATSNFSARRAEANDRYYQTKNIKHQSAPINPREIQAVTPSGTEELKNQLNGLQWTTAK